MSAELVPTPRHDPNDLGDGSQLLADLIRAFEAAAQARGTPTAEIRKGQLGLLESFGLLGDAGPPLSVVRDEEVPGAPVAAIAPMNRDPDLIRGFMIDQKRRGLRPATIRVRRIVMARASATLPNGLAGATKEDIETWLDKQHLLCTQSRRSYISHVRAFYTWAIENDWLDDNPTARIKGPRMGRRTPRPMPNQDLRRALATADPMMRCFLLLGAYEGMRCQEIAGLNREDVIEERGVIRITEGKGGHERIVPLHPAVLAALMALPMPPRGALFRRSQGHDRFPPSGVSEAINAYLHRRGIRSTAHSLRHWFATNIYAQSQDIRLTQELLGHSSPTTTAMYAKVDAKKAAPSVSALNVGEVQLPPEDSRQLRRLMMSYLAPEKYPLEDHEQDSRASLWDLCGWLSNDTEPIHGFELRHVDAGPCLRCEAVDIDTYGALARLVRIHLCLETAEDVEAVRLHSIRTLRSR